MSFYISDLNDEEEMTLITNLNIYKNLEELETTLNLNNNLLFNTLKNINKNKLNNQFFNEKLAEFKLELNNTLSLNNTLKRCKNNNLNINN